MKSIIVLKEGYKKKSVTMNLTLESLKYFRQELSEAFALPEPYTDRMIAIRVNPYNAVCETVVGPLPEDLKISFKVYTESAFNYFEFKVKCSIKPTNSLGDPTLGHSLSIALGENLVCDVVIKVDNQEIKLNKLLLMARSTVFRAMFENELSESKSGVIEIQDFKYETINTLIEFIYTDNVKEETDLVFDVLAAANKYDVKGLQVMAEIHLAKKLTADTIEEAIVFGKKHNLESFINRCVEFADRNKVAAKVLRSFLHKFN